MKNIHYIIILKLLLLLDILYLHLFYFILFTEDINNEKVLALLFASTLILGACGDKMTNLK